MMGRVLLVAWLVVVLCAWAFAGVGPENAVVVVNADSPSSLAVANEYVHLRGIAPSNVIYLSGISGPGISVDGFRERILKPVLAAIRDRGLSPQIDAILYSDGFAWAVDATADYGATKFPIYITQPSSLTGLTYLYEPVLNKTNTYLGMDVNWYYRRPKLPSHDTPWTDVERQQMTAVANLFEKYHAAGDKGSQDARGWLADAEAALRTLVGAHPDSPDARYNLACALALRQKTQEALAMLSAACRAGWWNAALAESDADMSSLKGRDDFKALMAKMRSVVITTQPAAAFHSATAWGTDGEPTASGRRFMLSAMLACTGGPANTLPEALDCLRTSVAADGTMPKGTVYFMASDDQARSAPRVWAFNSAAETLRKMGVGAEVLHGVLPPGKKDVAGAMVGIATFSWKDSGSTIVRGAFCDHLTSCGGIMTGGGQTLLSEFLRFGAAGASGTVAEPYAIQNKFPTPFFHVYYASGCTLVEAFYQSVFGPYQQLLVGDALCQPWARIPRVTVAGVKPGETVGRARRLTPTSTIPASRYELYVDGRLRSTAKSGHTLVLNPSGLAEGFHEARLVAVCGPTESRGRTIIPFRLGTKVVTLSLSKGDQTLHVTATCAGAKWIAIVQNGREVATIEGGSGSVDIPFAKTGTGPVKLQAVARLAADREVLSAPKSVTIQ